MKAQGPAVLAGSLHGQGKSGMGSKLDCIPWHHSLDYSREAVLALSVKPGTSDITDANADTTRQVSPLCRKNPHYLPF